MSALSRILTNKLSLTGSTGKNIVFPIGIRLVHYRNRNNRRDWLLNNQQFSPFASPFFGSDFNQIMQEFDSLTKDMLNLNDQLWRQMGAPMGIAAGGQPASIQPEQSQEKLEDSEIQTKGEKMESKQEKESNEKAVEAKGERSEKQIKKGESVLPVSSLFALSSDIKLDFEDQADKYIVSATVPDFNKEQLKLRVKNGYLTISGEVQEENKQDDFYTSNQRSVSRSIKLPANVEREGVSAKHENGKLVISLPKRQKVETPSDEIAIQ